MNWSRIKTIMICFLVFINVFLIGFMAITTYKENNISDDVVDSSLVVLSAKGFACDKNIFPNKKLSLPRLNVDFYSPSELCDIFFKKQVAFRTVGDYLIAQYDGATLEVKDNFFCYTTDSTPKRQMASAYKSALKKIGLDFDELEFDEKIQTFHINHKSIKLDDAYLKISLDENGDICMLKGVWPQHIRKGTTEKVSFSDEIVKLTNVFTNGGEIQSIKVIYSLYNSNNKKYHYKPLWEVTVDNETKIIQ